MTDSSKPPRSRLYYFLGAAGLVLLGAAGGWAFERQRSAIGPGQKAAIEKIVHAYLLEHPEVLPQAVEKLREKDSQKQLAGIAGKLTTPYPGVVMGNPQGSVTLVEFSDFACGYCRQSEPVLKALIAENPDLKVVIRHLPVIAPTSPAAAAMGLASAEQGKYLAFHDALFALGRTDPASVEAAARSAGLDLARAQAVSRQPQVRAELEANMAYARQLGFDGTPGWVVGDQVLVGAVGKDALAKAIAAARKT
ncbi:protein-disulfide isomerase [Novosphingobium kunmingense]|uniref:Protein-disulfide isomerase n=1 Tax=Novosphingobium kunmingense TaxID=1211806 RepID=A0A2N0H4S8_9SPHN|nr:DsbA family protein [Novosphingobium kunmingense]PKB13939.1 protein-disulfide isomerase [Novosphingobium kunmingense]